MNSSKYVFKIMLISSNYCSRDLKNPQNKPQDNHYITDPERDVCSERQCYQSRSKQLH